MCIRDSHHTFETKFPNEQGQKYCWFQCTIKGGREGRDFDVKQLIEAVEAMGAGEILLNCIDKDGTNSGFDLELINDVKSFTTIPVIASSGAGNPEHFAEVFEKTATDAALGAGMVRKSIYWISSFWYGYQANFLYKQFHRGTYAVSDVKKHLRDGGFLIREVE